MGTLSVLARNEMLDHIYKASYTAPANIYIALCTANPTEDGTGAAMNEVADANGYTRIEITFNTAATRKVIQTAEVTFPQATGSWGTITHYAILDSTAHGVGNMLGFGSFTSSFTPVSGNSPKIPINEVEISIVATIGSAAGLSDYTSHKLLDLMFRDQVFASTADSIYIAMSTTVLDDQDALTADFTEQAVADNYTRVSVPATSFGVSASGVITNTTAITFNVPSGDWSTIVSLVTMDSATVGNILGYDNDNVVDQAPLSGDTIEISIGNYTATLI